MQEFRKGDRVRVRSWNDMAKEFGVKGKNIISHNSYIATPLDFFEIMKPLCGETGVVAAVKKINVNMPNSFETEAQQLKITWDKPDICAEYVFDNGMFELITEEEGKKTYVNPVVSLDDENIAKKVTVSFTFDEPVTKKEAADNINEWFKKGNCISEAAITLTGDIGVKYANVQRRLGFNDKDPEGIGPKG